MYVVFIFSELFQLLQIVDPSSKFTNQNFTNHIIFLNMPLILFWTVTSSIPDQQLCLFLCFGRAETSDLIRCVNLDEEGRKEDNIHLFI